VEDNKWNYEANTGQIQRKARNERDVKHRITKKYIESDNHKCK
jgi:hypothetical protein